MTHRRHGEGGRPVPRAYFDDAGALCIDSGLYGENWAEAVCPKCGESIPWVLDMQAFVVDSGIYKMAHARCAWTAEAFIQQAQP